VNANSIIIADAGHDVLSQSEATALFGAAEVESWWERQIDDALEREDDLWLLRESGATTDELAALAEAEQSPSAAEALCEQVSEVADALLSRGPREVRVVAAKAVCADLPITAIMAPLRLADSREPFSLVDEIGAVLLGIDVWEGRGRPVGAIIQNDCKDVCRWFKHCRPASIAQPRAKIEWVRRSRVGKAHRLRWSDLSAPARAEMLSRPLPSALAHWRSSEWRNAFASEVIRGLGAWQDDQCSGAKRSRKGRRPDRWPGASNGEQDSSR
jgi:hypothetical protein